MKVDPKTTLDGFSAIPLGVNSGIPPEQLPDGQASWAVNMTFRNQRPTTRPAFVKRSLNFLDANGNIDGALRSSFQDNIFQGAIGFERRNQIIASIGGRTFRIRPDAWDVLDITPTTTDNPPVALPSNPNLYRAWFCESEDYLIRQDNQSAPWIYDGGSSRISDSLGVNGPKEIPVGNAMVYSQGRIVVSLVDRRSFSIGDIVGGPSGSVSSGFRDSMLKFTENELILTGGSFSIPINAGPITAVRPVAQVDTSTGQGPTQIFTTNAIFSLNTPTDRTTWKTVTYPIQTFSVVQAGSMSDRATVVVNGDIWMRAQDGVRSFVVARRDFGSWINTPQSTEVGRSINADDTTLLEYSSSALFDNRLLITTRPYRVFDHGVAHRGLVVIDFTPVSYLASSTRPNWEGAWCGLNILQVLSFESGGSARCFIFSLNSDNEIELWELTKDGVDDYDGSTSIPISGFIETKSFNFQDQGYDLKRLLKAWIWLTDLRGTLAIEASYRANEDPAWHEWHSWSISAQTKSCSDTQCADPLNLKPQYRRPFLLPTPDGECNESVGVQDNLGENFQARIDFTGHMRLAQVLVSASKEQEDVTGICPPTEPVRTVDYCEVSDFLYSIYT